ncbi:Uncharacterized protein SCF082_LOCUS32878 [Durusdinium trenchii]|uniref:Uncharacterized protein n=1 Tax=Durusdinium trenchii TaxID=1381693 RepID=A0ABP0NM24_9DINO
MALPRALWALGLLFGIAHVAATVATCAGTFDADAQRPGTGPCNASGETQEVEALLQLQPAVLKAEEAHDTKPLPEPSVASGRFKLKDIRAILKRMKELLPLYRENWQHSKDVLASLKNSTEHLDEKIANIPGQASTRLVPPSSSDGPCYVNVQPKATCKETQLESGACQFTISNKEAEASSRGTILSGCREIKDSFQELFLYCNDVSQTRRVTATTCGTGTAHFEHHLAAPPGLKTWFVNSSQCKMVGCTGDTGRRIEGHPCRDDYVGTGADPRATMDFTVPPGLCVFIIQQPGEAGQETDLLTISSKDFIPRGPTKTNSVAAQRGHPGPDAAERAVALQVDPIDGGATRGLAAEIRQDIKQGIKEVKEELEETFLTKLQQDHQELEQVKQHLSQELQMQQILPQLLEASASHSRASGAPGSPRGSAAKAERHFLAAFQRQHVEDGSGQFELCKDVSRTSQRKKPMASMEIDDGSYTFACCGHESLTCSGCMKLGTNGACDACAGGFVATNGACEACMDFKWESIEGLNCFSATCSDEKVRGFSSNEACCKCGGGHRLATEFSYFVGAAVVGSPSIVGHPVPRTTAKYSVDKDGRAPQEGTGSGEGADCELLKHGLTIDSVSGELKFVDGCTSVGCGASEAFAVSCTITAQQGSGLTASSQLAVIAYQGLSYGNAPLIFFEDVSLPSSYVPETVGSVTPNSFKLTCSPSDIADQLTVDATSGQLTHSGNAVAGSVTGYITAEVDLVSSTVPAMVLMPEIWSELTYGYVGTLYASLGQRSPLVKPVVEDGKLAPSRFSAHIPDSSASFDVLTGAGTYKGFLLFRLDVKTGYLRLEPSTALSDVLPQSETRAGLTVNVTIFAHYEWPALSTGPVQLTQLEVSVKDSTCWVSQSLSFATRTILGQESSVTALGACKSLCRSDPHCAHLSWNSSDSTCYSYGRLCFGACEYERIEVEARYASCGERTSCLNVSVADHFYLSGAYCPYGETAVGEMHGQAFLKIGRTEQDSFWLVAYNEAFDSHGTCGSGTGTVLRKPDTQEHWSRVWCDHKGRRISGMSLRNTWSNAGRSSPASTSVSQS